MFSRRERRAGTIQDYAVIGDGRSAALISDSGSIDWLCWSRFDSAAIFAAMLDPDAGGRWSISPSAESRATRRYLDKTNVLATTVFTSTAKTVLTDFMPVTSEAAGEGKEMFESGLAEWLAAEVCSAAPNSIQY